MKRFATYTYKGFNYQLLGWSTGTIYLKDIMDDTILMPISEFKNMVFVSEKKKRVDNSRKKTGKEIEYYLDDVLIETYQGVSTVSRELGVTREKVNALLISNYKKKKGIALRFKDGKDGMSYILKLNGNEVLRTKSKSDARTVLHCEYHIVSELILGRMWKGYTIVMG